MDLDFVFCIAQIDIDLQIMIMENELFINKDCTTLQNC